MKIVRTGVVVLVLVLLAVPVVAHVPSFSGDNTTPERAIVVSDAVKSWSFYDTLREGTVAYYRVSLQSGERLVVSTYTPDAGPFVPSLVVMSPSIDGSDDVPEQVTVPEGMGAIVVEGERPDRASYEPFAPSASYQTASLTRPVEAETTYLIAVYEPERRAGAAGVAVGYAEEFTPVEYATVPFRLVQTHLWEGQHPLVAVGPFLLMVVLGVGRLWKRLRARSPPEWGRLVLGSAGVAVLATGVNTAVQMGLALAQSGFTGAALVTAVYVVVPLVCGGWVVWVTTRRERLLTRGVRVGLAVAGVVSLVTWAGYLVGPALLVLGALAPKRLFHEPATER